jgi:hypothetical protein
MASRHFVLKAHWKTSWPRRCHRRQCSKDGSRSSGCNISCNGSSSGSTGTIHAAVDGGGAPEVDSEEEAAGEGRSGDRRRGARGTRHEEQQQQHPGQVCPPWGGASQSQSTAGGVAPRCALNTHNTLKSRSTALHGLHGALHAPERP